METPATLQANVPVWWLVLRSLWQPLRMVRCTTPTAGVAASPQAQHAASILQQWAHLTSAAGAGLAPFVVTGVGGGLHHRRVHHRADQVAGLVFQRRGRRAPGAESEHSGARGSWRTGRNPGSERRLNSARTMSMCGYRRERGLID
eukprot:scaffold8780_cov130-Isochrysis_galbana.AAC.14